jgi:hypothetical protein
MKIPDTNQSTKSKQKTSPVQRWTAMASLLICAVLRDINGNQTSSLVNTLTGWRTGFAEKPKLGSWSPYALTRRLTEINASPWQSGVYTPCASKLAVR